ncbi:MAG TPA: right-handed parallel beta-helix repeat-containing protein, partial [Candidatus Marinimicrobia bacterium]|nr:right-handed parallel beta-helix repeat-containing protein [Candidatus Neomarinimicrobiota bacterium]
SRSETTPDMGAMEFTVEGSALAGSYTVGSGGDYDSISTALSDLSVYGISGPVTFNILPGIYTEQSTIGEVYGASSINTLTIQSSTGDTADVSWQYTPTSSANYVLKVNGTDHLTIKNISFDVSASSSYGTILEISGETDSLRIEGNEFRGYDYTGSSANYYLVESTANTGTGMVFTSNTFLEGSAGIYLSNGSADDGELKITNNTTIGQYYGLYVNNIDSVEISGNTVAGDHSGIGIYVYSCRPAIVTGNKVTENTVNAMSKGMYIYECDGNSSGERTLITNNMVKAYGKAIELYYTGYADIYYNTLINTYTSSGTSNGTLYIQSSSEMNVKNNIITNTSGGRLVYKWSGSSITFDYNMYYGGSTDFGFYHHNPSVNGNFTSWQDDGFDANGVLQDPGFYEYGDGFHLGAGNSLGTPVTEVTIDFDNEPRDETTPDIGADEYLAPNYDGIVEVPGEITTIQGAI